MNVRVPKIMKIRKNKWDGIEYGFILRKLKTLIKHHWGGGCCGRILVPRRGPYTNSVNLWICYIPWKKKDIANVIKLGPWDGEFILDFLDGWVQTGVFKSRRGGQKRSNAIWEGPHLPLLALEEGATSQGLWAASKSWKRQANRFSPESRERNTTLLTLNFSPVRLELDF